MKTGWAVGAVTGLAAVLAVGFQGRIAEPDIDRPPPRAPAAAIDREQRPPKLPDQKRPKRPKSKPARKPPPPRVLALGVKGPDVRSLQQSLTRATYDPGPADGSFGYMTQHAVLAFEKVNGLEIDGRVTEREARVLTDSGPPRSPGPGTYIDVDITRQVLFEIQNGVVIHTLPVSTANGATYESRSGLATAYTPRGRFSIYSKTPGWRTSYLGSLYNPSYFYGGYAIHGSASVPPYPASHGCVRIPMHSADDFFARNGIGTEVLVHD